MDQAEGASASGGARSYLKAIVKHVGSLTTGKLTYPRSGACLELNFLRNRLGARDMELSVWEVPGDVEGKEYWPAVVDACESLWKDHYMARLGTPEV